MSAIHIYDVRFSFIFTETNLNILWKKGAANAPCAFVADENQFSARFNMLRESPCKIDSTSITLRPPWQLVTTRDRFWKSYCETDDPQQVPGSQAWQQLIPIHRAFSERITLPDDQMVIATIGIDVRPHLVVLIDGFLNQFGMALTATFKYIVTPTPGAPAATIPSLSPQQLIALGMYLQNDKLLVESGELAGENGEAEKISLADLAARALTRMRDDILGPNATIGDQSDEPFSVVTIVHADGCRPEDAPKPKKEIHEILEACSTWNRGYKLTMPGTIAECAIEYKGKPIAGDILYTGKRGRVIWFPSKFTKSDSVQHTLSCYHRNLTFLSMHVERLSNLCRRTAHMLQDGTSWMNLSTQHRNHAKRAGDILGRLYGKGDRTYRSLSPRYQIEKNKYKDDIDMVRKAAGGDPLYI